jgi:dipeptide/tripeptide permease
MLFKRSDAEKKKERNPFHRSFWVANTMEIFERMAWYGFFTVSSLYITGAVSEGCLGFTSEQRGTLQGVIIFIIYLLPVLTGALADRFGYKKTFFISYLMMVPAYYFLGQFKTYETFFLAFLMVAIGAATFKPVVVGTVAKTTDDSNRAMGFGIFYMMVNIGGLMGPIVAGIIRGWSWNYVFIASAFWIALNFIWLGIFYKEPTTEASSATRRTLKQVMNDMVEVLGNTRFFITIFVTLIVLMLAGNEWLSWTFAFYSVVVWIAGNMIVDIHLRKAGSSAKIPPMKVGNWRFALYLLILSGFWTAFDQIFLTMPEYIRDFVDTSDMLPSLGGFFHAISYISPDVISRVLDAHLPQVASVLSPSETQNLLQDLLASRIRIDAGQLQSVLDQSLVIGQSVTPEQLHHISEQLIRAGHQVNPEYLIKFDAASIVCFQLLISYLVAKWDPFKSMIIGVAIAALGIAASAFLHTGWFVVLAIVAFSFGEMMASPKSQQYIASIAPEDKKALYMGYAYWAVALGGLFGGILSGQAYGKLAREMGRPDLMWLMFGVLGLVTAIALMFYNRYAIKGRK